MSTTSTPTSTTTLQAPSLTSAVLSNPAPNAPPLPTSQAGPSRPRAERTNSVRNFPSIDLTDLSDGEDSPSTTVTATGPPARAPSALSTPHAGAPLNGASTNGSGLLGGPSPSVNMNIDQTTHKVNRDDENDDFTITASTGPTHPPSTPSRGMANHNAIAGPSGGPSINGFQSSQALGLASAAAHNPGFSSYAARPQFAAQYGMVTPPLLPGQGPPPVLSPRPGPAAARPGSDATAPIDVDNMPPVATPPPKRPLCIGGFMGRAVLLYPNKVVNVGYVPPPEAKEQLDVVMYRTAEMLRIKLKLRKAGSAPRPDEPWAAVMKDTIQVMTVGGSYIGDLEGPATGVLINMLSRGLCRLEGFAMRIPADGPQYEVRLNVLVFTLPSNVQYIANTLAANNTFCMDPMPPYDPSRYASEPVYMNAHGSHEIAYRMYLGNQQQQQRPSGYLSSERDKASMLEVQRKQVDEVFKSIASGVELEQSDPGPWIKTNLFPHQRKALTFLLQGEQDWSSLKEARKRADKLLKKGKSEDADEGSPREDSAPRDISDFKSDTSRSLWEPIATDDNGRVKSWKNKITGETSRGGKKPKDCRGAILADDMGLGKTLSVVSLIAATHRAAKEWGEKKLEKVDVPDEVEKSQIPASAMTTKVFGMPSVDDDGYDGPKGKKRRRDEDKDDKAAQLARRAQIVKRSKATLLVCPMSTITNWEDQIKEHWNGRVEVVGGTSPPVRRDAEAEPLDPDWDILRVYIYHGTSRKADPRFLAEFDIVITSYSTLANEYSKQCATAGDDTSTSTPVTGVNSDEEDSSRGSASRGVGDDIKPADIVEALKSKTKRTSRRKLGQGDQSPLQAVDWFRVVLDEAHSIKSTATVACKATCALEAERRIALTGTPIQNKIEDVWALFKFLRLSPIDNKDVFSKFVTTPCKTGEQLGIARLQLVMRACCLRRTKETSDNGTKILNLPARKEGQVWLELREDERKIYTERRNAAQANIETLKATKQLTQNYAHVLQQLLRLRQTCDHVDLPKSGAAEEDYDGTIMDYEVAVKGIEQLGLSQHRAQSVICTQKDMANGSLCAECGVDFGPYFPSIGLGGVEDDVKSEAVEVKKGKKDPRPILTKCMHILCLGCFRKSVFSKYPRGLEGVTRQCATCETMLRLSRDVIEVVPPSDGNNEDIPKKTVARKKWERNPLEPPTYSRKMQFLADDLMPFSKRNPKSANFSPFYDLEETADGEVMELDDDGNPLITKSVVFSQWTTMLDRIEDMLRELQIKCCRLDGSMSREERARQIEQLRSDKATEVMLVSTRAGGVGLNLTAANRAYLVDPYWNPSVEAQAIDRIHRMGQKRPVVALKLMIKDSVEEKLDEIQRKKADLAKLSLKNMSRKELMEQKADELVKLFSK